MYNVQSNCTNGTKLSKASHMDQSPLTIVSEESKTYNVKGAEEMWCTTDQSGLNKRQCSVPSSSLVLRMGVSNSLQL